MTATLVYDADCGLCTAGVRLLSRLDCDVEVVPSTVWIRAHPEHARRCEDAILLVVGDGRVLESERAVAATLRRCRRPARAIGVAIDAPGIRVLAARAYRWVAAHRAALSARLGLRACGLPEGGDRTAVGNAMALVVTVHLEERDGELTSFTEGRTPRVVAETTRGSRDADRRRAAQRLRALPRTPARGDGRQRRHPGPDLG